MHLALSAHCFRGNAAHIRPLFTHVIIRAGVYHPGNMSDADNSRPLPDKRAAGPNKRGRRWCCFMACLMENSVLLNLDITILISQADPHRILHTHFFDITIRVAQTWRQHLKYFLTGSNFLASWQQVYLKVPSVPTNHYHNGQEWVKTPYDHHDSESLALMVPGNNTN